MMHYKLCHGHSSCVEVVPFILIDKVTFKFLFSYLFLQKTVMKTTWGVLDPPVGNTRLNVVRLVASLLQTNTHIINQELINLNTLGVILVSGTVGF